MSDLSMLVSSLGYCTIVLQGVIIGELLKGMNNLFVLFLTIAYGIYYLKKLN